MKRYNYRMLIMSLKFPDIPREVWRLIFGMVRAQTRAGIRELADRLNLGETLIYHANAECIYYTRAFTIWTARGRPETRTEHDVCIIRAIRPIAGRSVAEQSVKLCTAAFFARINYRRCPWLRHEVCGTPIIRLIEP
jgi:hypothetical protein